MKNYKNIKQMTFDEMLELLAKSEDLCEICAVGNSHRCSGHCFGTREEIIKEWLETDIKD